MVGKYLVLGFMALVAMSAFVSAATEVEVETLPFHDVTIAILKPQEQYELIDSFPPQYSKLEGEVNVTYEGDVQEFNVLVVVKKNGVLVLNEKFENQESGGLMKFEVFPEDYVREDEAEVTEEIQVAEENVEENIDVSEEVGSSAGVTGQAISEREFSIPKFSYYIIGAVLLVGILALIIGRKTRVLKSRESDDKTPRKVERVDVSQDTIADAERKIQEAMQELNRLKANEERIHRIRDAERKIQEDQERLERLRREE